MEKDKGKDKRHSKARRAYIAWDKMSYCDLQNANLCLTAH
jgi:hypothetical protein